MIVKLKVGAPLEDFDESEDIALAVPVTIPEMQEIHQPNYPGVRLYVRQQEAQLSICRRSMLKR